MDETMPLTTLINQTNDLLGKTNIKYITLAANCSQRSIVNIELPKKAHVQTKLARIIA